MTTQNVKVPLSLLLDPDMAPTAKVIWMARRLNRAALPADLELQTGLTRNTVQHWLAQGAASIRTPGGPRVMIPGALLSIRSVGPQAKVLYGILQTVPHFKGNSGAFTYASLRDLTGLSRNTLKRALNDLKGAGWIRLTQANQPDPI